jgi:citrate synthase
VSGADWIGANEAARRLGVKPATLYAYVSRGVLRRRRAPGGRSSLFDPAEVDALARRGRPRRPRNPAELILESALTTFVDEEPVYRGMPVLTLARDREFEDVAALLWTGDLPAGRNDPTLYVPVSPAMSADNFGHRGSQLIATGAFGWQATPEAIAAAVAAQSGLPADTLPLERLQVIVPALAATDQVRLHLDPPAVVTAAQSVIAGMVDCLPDATLPDATVPGATLRGATPSDMSPAAAPSDAVPTGMAFHAAESPDATRPSHATGRLRIERGSITARLWPKLSPADPQLAILDVLRAALVLLADHELAASTLAARVAASVRADPYAVVATGLGAVGGALHGGSSLGAEVMLADVHEPGQASRVIGDRLRRGERIPGLGHFVYRKGDPRGTFLLALLHDAVSAHPPGVPRGPRALAAADAVLAEAHRRRLPEPNIDFALAALVAATGMIKGAGEAIFAVARAAGWIAHALEEYARRTPLRPRAVYVGPSPARNH